MRRVVPDETPGAFSTIHVHMMSHDAMAAARFYERMFGARVIASQGANGLPRANMSMGGLTYLISQVVSAPYWPPMLLCLLLAFVRGDGLELGSCSALKSKE